MRGVILQLIALTFGSHFRKKTLNYVFWRNLTLKLCKHLLSGPS